MKRRSRESLLVEFDQLLNMLFPVKGMENLWMWKEPNVENGVFRFCREALQTVPVEELRSYANQNWLTKRGYTSRADVVKSLNQLLDTQIPLRK